MRFVFPALLIVAVAVGAPFVVRAVRGQNPVVEQPIAFNHTLHVESAGLECGECHTTATTSVYAGLPSKSICLDCHDIDEEIEEGSELAKLVPFADSDEDLPWKRVAVTVPDVFFSHRRHVTSGGIDCLRCHVDQRTQTTPPRTARLVMTMDDCIDCHEQNQTSTDCLACHR